MHHEGVGNVLLLQMSKYVTCFLLGLAIGEWSIITIIIVKARYGY